MEEKRRIGRTTTGDSGKPSLESITYVSYCQRLILNYSSSLMKFLLTNHQIEPKKAAQLPFELTGKTAGPFYILVEEPGSGLGSDNCFSITDGYVRNLSLQISDEENKTEQVVQQNYPEWPFPTNITGSFSSTIVDNKSNEIILCNDLIGIYPLYYLTRGNDFYVSNSIILMGAVSGGERDEVGTVQRCLGPEFSNIGSRTILQDCKRLLPGEWIKFDAEGNKKQTRYDNSLYQQLSSPEQKHELHKEYWQGFKKDMAYSLNRADEVKLALSGGIDSRILLGAIPIEKKISCLTYGEADNYETKIASRLAKIKKATFCSFSQPELSFPGLETLTNYTLHTEALHLYSWLQILENVPSQRAVPFLVGDFTTALTGRTIKKFSGKKVGPKNFVDHYILNRNYEFEANTSESYERWKRSISQKFERWYSEKRLLQFKTKDGREELISSLKTDLNELFFRIEQHRLPFIELVDELFTWYTHSRIPMGKQVLICNRDFHAYCPSMSMQNLRLASNIHPNLRLSFRFVKKLFREVPELKKFRKIPTSQAPLVPQSAPDFVKFPVWGLRAKIDDHLIKELMKSKDPDKPYRLFKSNNWAQVYQHPNMEKNLKVYFKKNHLGEGYFNYLLKQAVLRKKLEQWPFANMEMLNAASLNIELDLIQSLNEDQ